jgi:hypothetical protein
MNFLICLTLSNPSSAKIPYSIRTFLFSTEKSPQGLGCFSSLRGFSFERKKNKARFFMLAWEQSGQGNIKNEHPSGHSTQAQSTTADPARKEADRPRKAHHFTFNLVSTAENK